MFINSFAKDVEKITQYAFTEEEKDIQVKHQALVQRAEYLKDLKEFQVYRLDLGENNQ